MRKVFKVILIKPSKYDDDGYVLQFWRTNIPSNSLAALYGLVQDCAERGILGPDVDIEIDVHDECNTAIRTDHLIKRISDCAGGFVGLVGVQSNQFPRALDIARDLRKANIAVVIGGFHVSGCMAMLPDMPPDLTEALELGVTLFAGEGEQRMSGLIQDIHAGRQQPIYNYLKDTPSMINMPAPWIPAATVNRTLSRYTSFDAGRGCPFQCSFCTIINVQGRVSRYRSADDVEAIVRANNHQGVTGFFVTDDNFARNKNWEAILDRLIMLKRTDVPGLRLIFQVDTLCHRIPNFIEKVAQAGCMAVFIGLENINPESLINAKKRQNKIWEYREMFQAWQRAKVITSAGYIIGFPTDTPQSIARDIEFIKQELPVDILEFFVLTPLPGSEDHLKLYKSGARLDPDMNNYELEHFCADHPMMSKEEWRNAYLDAWARYYSQDHVETIMKRAAASGRTDPSLYEFLIAFSGAVPIENIHPLQQGLFRRKIRKTRRHGMRVVNPLLFYPVRLLEIIANAWRWGRVALPCLRAWNRIMKDPQRFSYTDLALTPPTPGNDEVAHFVHVFADKIPDTHGAPFRTHAIARRATSGADSAALDLISPRE